MAVLTKVSVGYCSTAKKSSDRRCVSRSGWPVSMLAAWIVNRTDERSGCASSKSMVPAKSENRPRTLQIRWRTWKVASEWAVSIWSVRTGVATAVVMACVLSSCVYVITFVVITLYYGQRSDRLRLRVPDVGQHLDQRAESSAG